jgi:hypothetical protein
MTIELLSLGSERPSKDDKYRFVRGAWMLQYAECGEEERKMKRAFYWAFSMNVA